MNKTTFTLLLVCSVLLCSCYSNRQKQTNTEVYVPNDLEQIKASGQLNVVTLYSSISYFQYKLENMGYEYDMIKAFAKSENLELNVIVAENQTRLIEILLTGQADVVAYPIQINNKLKQDVLFCGREQQSSQVLIQRANKKDSLLTDVTQLIGKKVYVKGNTKYEERLLNLNAELGGGIQIEDINKDTVTVEDLIEMVSRPAIPYTISDENIARLNKTYFSNINTSLKVSFLQRSSWVVRKNSPALGKAINEWADNQSGKRSYKAAMKRYFESSKKPEEEVPNHRKKGTISYYDHLFKKYQPKLGWDWELLASIAYQESRFNANIVSWAGAEGLMGIMPGTARRLGFSRLDLKNPDVAVRAGVECLRRFRQGFSEVSNEEDKIKFTLAAYNAGIGHIFDAQRLATKYGKNPKVWDDNVSEYIRLKSDPIYYNDSVCKHGYMRGSETSDYVNEVMQRYHKYKETTNKKEKS